MELVVLTAVVFITCLNFIEKNSYVRNNIFDLFGCAVLICYDHIEFACTKVKVIFTYLVVVKVTHNFRIAVLGNSFCSLTHKCNNNDHCNDKHKDIDHQTFV